MEIEILNSGFHKFLCKAWLEDGRIIIDVTPHHFYKKYGYKKVEWKTSEKIKVHKSQFLEKKNS